LQSFKAHFRAHSRASIVGLSVQPGRRINQSTHKHHYSFRTLTEIVFPISMRRDETCAKAY
jgi:hypothetical protein